MQDLENAHTVLLSKIYNRPTFNFNMLCIPSKLGCPTWKSANSVVCLLPRSHAAEDRCRTDQCTGTRVGPSDLGAHQRIQAHFGALCCTPMHPSTPLARPGAALASSGAPWVTPSCTLGRPGACASKRILANHTSPWHALAQPWHALSSCHSAPWQSQASHQRQIVQ